VASASSGQVAVPSAPAVIAAPVTSATLARADSPSVRATTATGNLAAVESLLGSNGGSGGFVDVAATMSQASDGASPSVAPGDHGLTSVASGAPGAGARASGKQDSATIVILEVESEGAGPRLPGVLDGPMGIAGGRRAEVAGQPSRRAAWAEALALRGADVQTVCSPFDRGAIERAIDAFLGELGRSSGTSLSGIRLWTEAIPGVLVAAVALGILEVERRQSRGRNRPRIGNQNDPEAPLPGFPGRRFAWSMED
jgi:hypothetical protein